MNESLMSAAERMQQAGNAAEAARLYGAVLDTDPRNIRALYRLGMLHFGNGRYEAAARLFGEAAKVDPKSVDAHFAQGCALQRLGRPEEALDAFANALALKPGHAEALVNRGVALLDLERHEEAAACFGKALAADPARAELWLAHGNALASAGRFEEALASYGKALALKRDLAEAWNNRGAALFTLGRFDEAVASYDALLAARPREVMALVNRGIAIARMKRYAEALASFDKALALEPHRADAHYHRGAALLGLQRYEEALPALDRSLAAEPENADALVVRGIALKELARLDEALASYDRALAVKTGCPEALVNREAVLFALKRYEEAAGDCERALALDPGIPNVRGDLAYYRLQCCDWRGLPEARRAIAAGLREGRRVVQPFMNLAIAGSPEGQLQCARIWAANECAASGDPLWRGERYGHGRIRVAYVSGDFRAHPVGQSMAGVYECHDKRRFETIGISFGEDDSGPIRRRAMEALERFVDVRHRNDYEVASLLRAMEVDIAVDLMGFTGASRTGIFAQRPAPVQVNYLGYPGTMGTGCIDYLLADRTVIPDGSRAYCSEAVAYLPDSYMPHDRKRQIADRTPTRAEAGLPERGFVFCSFNNGYKFSPEFFDVWMRLLLAVEGSILWLPRSNDAAVRNLRREAAVRGVAPERLVFAPFVPKSEDHLARLRLGDLFLDTLPCNGQTTASDALWAGLPVLTCLGSTFAGRISASLSQAARLPETIARSIADYEVLALRFARDPEALGLVKAKLAKNRDTCPLFDTARFTRHLEAGYAAMWARRERGEAPASFAVEGEA